MEGHNTHGARRLDGGFRGQQVMERYKLPGTVAISFGPAEEQLASRPFIGAPVISRTSTPINLSSHSRFRSATGYGVRIMRRSARSSRFTARPRTRRVNRGTGRTRSTPSSSWNIGFDKLREHLRPT